MEVKILAYAPTKENIIASFLQDGIKFQNLIYDANTYIQYGRYTIISNYMVLEMLLNLKLYTDRNKISTLPINPDLFSGNKYNSIDKIKNLIEKHDLSSAQLLFILENCMDPQFCGLISIDHIKLGEIQRFRDIRNKLIHEGLLIPQDITIIRSGSNILKDMFEEIVGQKYSKIYFIEDIEKIPNEDFYIEVKELFYKILENWEKKEYVEVYSRAKFIICYLLMNAVNLFVEKGYERFFNLEIFRNFIEIEPRHVYFPNISEKLFKLGFLHIFHKFKQLMDESCSYIYSKKPEKIYIPWIDDPLIFNIMKKYLKMNPLPELKIEKLSDDDVYEKLIVNYSCQYNWLKEKNPEDRKELIKVLIEESKKIISPEIAEKLLHLALKFNNEFLAKYYY